MHYITGNYRLRQHGYTLTQLIYSILIVSILGTIAIPAYSSIMTKQEILSSLSAFHHSVMLARSESVKRNNFVVVCPSLDGENCLPEGRNFSKGWITFNNSDRDYPIVRDANEDLIESVQLQNHHFSLISNRRAFTFRPINKRNTNGTLMLCPHQQKYNYQHQAVIISYTGRPRLDRKPKKKHIDICKKIDA